MCTVSWIHTPGGYHLLSNRDEKKTRAAAWGPRIETRGGVRFIAPVDGESGGTWIAVNEFGISICLLNGAPGGRPFRSRGLLVRELIWAESAGECVLWLKQLDLALFAPFTALFLEPGKPSIVAKWDGGNTIIICSAESLMPLTSSSFDPEGVREIRSNEFRRDTRLDPAQLYQFHASHRSQPDAYSPCMHRADAETVSFSWINVTENEIRFSYLPSAPCKPAQTEQQVLHRAA